MARTDRFETIALLCKIAGQSGFGQPSKTLQGVPLIRWHLDMLERELVAKARTENVTWAQIGAALEMSRQAAWEKFNREPANRPAVSLDRVWHVPL